MSDENPQGNQGNRVETTRLFNVPPVLLPDGQLFPADAEEMRELAEYRDQEAQEIWMETMITNIEHEVGEDNVFVPRQSLNLNSLVAEPHSRSQEDGLDDMIFFKVVKRVGLDSTSISQLKLAHYEVQFSDIYKRTLDSTTNVLELKLTSEELYYDSVEMESENAEDDLTQLTPKQIGIMEREIRSLVPAGVKVRVDFTDFSAAIAYKTGKKNSRYVHIFVSRNS